MRTQLAEKLLVRIMEWSPRAIMKERPLLQALATFKYDEYQQFSPGTRFIESLVKWLSQFQRIDQRQIAYEFIKGKLIFISQDQMVYLVNLTFTDQINPHLIRKSSKYPLSQFQVSKIVQSAYYKEALRRSLFIGLSDGARMDQLRRSAHLSNEQVILTYEIGQPKAAGLIKDLEKDKYVGQFTSFFLIDDFTASGTSYFRFENGEWKGKIFKTLESLLVKKEKNGDLYELANHEHTVEIHIIFYIATKSAIDKLNDRIFLWQQEKELNFSFTIDTVQLIDNDVRESTIADAKFIKLAEEYFDDSIVDEHFKKAKYDEPHLGYDECGLPLVLVHNTPNNSLPVLWLQPSDDKDFTGLFPRVTRHK